MSITVECATLKVVPLIEMLCGADCGCGGGTKGACAGDGGGTKGARAGGGNGGVTSSMSLKSGRSLGVMRVWSVSGIGGARTRGAGGGACTRGAGGGACTRGAGGGSCTRGAGGVVGVEGACFGVVCKAEPIGVVWLL